MKRLLGKPVLVEFPDGSRVGGVLTFAGINTFLSKRQLTVGRMPIFDWVSVGENKAWGNPKVSTTYSLEVFESTKIIRHVRIKRQKRKRIKAR